MFLLLLILRCSCLPIPICILLTVGQNLSEGLHHTRHSVRFLLLASNFVLELAQAGPRFASSGEVKHAGSHVVSHELNVQKHLSSVFVCLASLVQQLKPSVKDSNSIRIIYFLNYNKTLSPNN